LTQAYRKELAKFDAQRVVAAWDGLISKQQAALESLGVPAMYVTDLTLDREVSLDHFPAPLPSLTRMIAARHIPLESDRDSNASSGYLRAL
jgi:hypothetical protein